MMHFLSSIGAFALYLTVSLMLMTGFIFAYLRSTPHDEFEQLRKGNTAAAIGLAGALIAYAMVLSRAVGFSTDILELILWGLIGLAIQIVGHHVLSRFIPRLYVAIEEGDLASGIMKAAVAVTLGLINAASMSP
jgi:putative membrane protein